jgi:Family of unknown function (DUF6325)
MTAAGQPGSDDDELGPVDFLAIEFPGGRVTAAGFERLLSLADQGVLDILDMEFITKDADGKSKKVDVWEFAVPEGVDLSAWAGASSGLLDDSDVSQISGMMQPGTPACPHSPGVRRLRRRRGKSRKPQPQSPRAPSPSTAAMKPSGSTRLMISELTSTLRKTVLSCRGR